MFYLLPLLGLQLLRTSSGGSVYPPLVSTSEAHGPLARLALDSARVSHPLQYYQGAAPAQAVAHLAKAVPAVVNPLQYYTASAPTVTHITKAAPAIIHAPVVQEYLPQPGYVQRIVDVPTTRLAKAKLQVRRPAIQKEFYDIEQRTVVRPVGSAVVELNEPLSKNLLSPFSVSSPGQPHQLVYPVNAYPYPFAPYPPYQVPVQSYPPSFTQRPQFVGQRPGLAPQFPQQVPPYPPQQIQPLPPTSQPAEQLPPQQSPPTPEQPSSEDSSENAEFDSSDTVVINNPDFERSQARSNSGAASESSGNDFQESTNNQQRNDNNEDVEDVSYRVKTQRILDEFQNRQLLRMFTRQPALQPPQRFQPIFPLQPFGLYQQPNTFQLDDAKQFQRFQGIPPLEPIDDASEATNSTTNTSTSTTESSEITSTTESEPISSPRSSSNSEERAQTLQVKTYSSDGQIPSVTTLDQNQLQENQQKLIELLTGRGGISEIDLSKPGVRLSVVGDTGVVRGRVLSVTPAPLADQLGDERVSTRRVVVSRPIQTLEEIDVQQPFTKVERVAVHEPALLKTSYPHVPVVATAVPFLASTPAALVYHH